MKKTYIDTENNFIETFDTETGFYLRSGVIKETKDGLVDTNIDPFMRNFPGLIDIGVMGSCIHGQSGKCLQSGIRCYQSGNKIKENNMSVEMFRQIIEECKNKVFQVALGGRGDVNKHENFEELLKICKENEIVPNYTTSGLDLTDEEVKLTKNYCGAVAVSEYFQEHTYRALDMFIKSNITTNIHFVLSNSTIDIAIDKIKNNKFHKGINAVIFLLHKPVGLGSREDVLNINDSKVTEFFELIDKGGYDFQIGFDSCTIPGIINKCKNIDKKSIDTCEAARFSMYIDAQGNMMPCSFDNQQKKWAISFPEFSIMDAWKSDKFNNFRQHFLISCPTCKDRLFCLGGCPIVNEIVLCDRIERC